MADMADGIVVELGYTARELDLFCREQERLANEHGSAMALLTLINIRAVVPEHMPDYVKTSVVRMEAYVAEHGWDAFEVWWGNEGGR